MAGHYAGFVLALLILVRWVGDAWWGVIPLLFAPRWVFLFPIPLLAFIPALRRSWGEMGVIGATALVVAGPLMGLSFPVGNLLRGIPAGERVRIATVNLGSDPFPTLALEDWLRDERVEIVCFQEGPKAQPFFQALSATGWTVNSARSIATRLEVLSEPEPMPTTFDTERRFTGRVDRLRLRSRGGREFEVASAHLPTLRQGFERLMDGDVAGLRLHVDWWGREMSRILGYLGQASGVPQLVGGDFNMPGDDATMAALSAYYRNAFEEAGWGYGYTRPAAFPWVRIDHVLTTRDWLVTRCRVGPDFGSDHRPVVAEVVLPSDPR